MPVTKVVTFIVLVSALAVLCTALSKRTSIALPTSLVLLGFAVGQWVEYFHIDTGFRYNHFNEIVAVALLPPLVFHAGTSIDLRRLREDLWLVAALGVLGLPIAAAIISVVLYFGVGHSSGFPWVAAFLCGAILAATDPDAARDALQGARASPRLKSLVETEGLANDAGAVVLFAVILDLALDAPNASIDLSIAVRFLEVAVLSTLIGGAAAVVTSMLLPSEGGVEWTLSSIALAWGVYLVADAIELSGVFAVVAAAVTYRWWSERKHAAAALERSLHTWRAFAVLSEASAYILVGFAVTVSMFRERWLAMLIGIAAVIVARLAVAHVVIGLHDLFRPNPVGLGGRSVVAFTGLRGAVAIVLAFSIPTTLPYWWTIQSIVFGVVVFDLVVQLSTSTRLLRALVNAPGHSPGA